MTHPMSARRLVQVLATVTALVSAVHCSSSSSSNEGGCASVCDCVQSKGGDRGQCLSQCNEVLSSSSSTAEKKSECESRLDANGVGSCKSTCASAVQAGTGSGSGSGSARSALCEKCASCVGRSDFSEGFCDQYMVAGSFSVSSCNASSDTSELANPGVSASTVSGWSCDDFDQNE